MALHPVTERQGGRGGERGEKKESGFSEAAANTLRGCWLLVITQTDRHSQQHEKQTGEAEEGWGWWEVGDEKKKDEECVNQNRAISGARGGKVKDLCF